jgi:cytochrome c biogenesis protein CcdA
MLLIAFLGGVLTLLSPCILPVLPLLLSRAGGPAWSPLLTLIGLASGFAVLASLAVVSSDWVIGASQWSRYLALGLLAVSALALLSTPFGTWLSRPWLWLGNRLHGNTRRLSPALSAWLLGCAAGLLWAPCAGPILGLILSSGSAVGAGRGRLEPVDVYQDVASLAGRGHDLPRPFVGIDSPVPPAEPVHRLPH